MPSSVKTPDGLIDLDELEETSLDDMWAKWPTVAFWIWDNREMVKNNPREEDGLVENYYACAYQGGWG